MTRAFVCGNGISRQAVDLTQLRPLGKIYGCNGLYRDFEPDCLVATDKPIAESIQNSGYSATHRFYTRRPIHKLGALPVPKKYHGNSSSPSKPSRFVIAISVTPFSWTALRTSTASNHPQRRARPVVEPNSLPIPCSKCPSVPSSVTKGPPPTRHH